MMTREEAIAVLEESKRQNENMKDNPTTFWASYQIADGIKNTKRRIDALDAALSALRPVSREQVEKVWKGDWLRDFDTGESICGNCHHVIFPKDYVNGELPHFCEFCGEAKTDEAVQMVMERMKLLYEHNA